MTMFWTTLICLMLVALMFMVTPLLQPLRKKATVQRDSYIFVLILFVLLPTLSLALYAKLGRGHDIKVSLHQQEQDELLKKKVAQFGSREQIIQKLHHKLQELPENKNAAQGWYILGKLYFNEKHMTQQAVDSFKKATQLNPDEPEYRFQYIASRFLIDKKLSASDRDWLQKTLMTRPKDVNIINLLALDAYQSKYYSEAISYWQQLLSYFPADSQDAKALLSMIEQSQSHLKFVDSKINVIVQVDSNLKSKIQQTAILYVYAIPIKGSQMPLAVTRVPFTDLIQKVLLDAEKGMLPGRSIMTVDQFKIEARISNSGNALPSKGDLIGSSLTLSRSMIKNVLRIRINHVIDK